MRKFLIAVLVMIMSLCVIFAFTACSKTNEPAYCGIYYLDYENGEPQTKIEVTEKYIAINGSRQTYTYDNNIITLENGVKLEVAENNQVLYIPDIAMTASQGFLGGINVRDGYFETNIKLFSGYNPTNSYKFSLDGTFQFTDISNLTNDYGTYTLNNGVLILHGTKKVSYGQEISQDYQQAWYIDENFVIHGSALLKDFNAFLPRYGKETTPDGLILRLKNDNTYEVIGINDETVKEVNIPYFFKNIPVTSIRKEAFEWCGSLTSITIPDSVISIGDWAFYNCGELTNVTIGNNVTSIGALAFYYCTNLTSVIIPNSVTSISALAFEGCSLANVYYKGQENDWKKISIDSSNTQLTNATRYYYTETEPKLNVDGTDYDGKYWHYGENGEIVVWKKN